MVRRNQYVDRVLRNANVRCNNIVNIVEEVLTRSGVNIVPQRPNYSSPLSNYIRHAKLSRGCKVPKFTKSVDDVNESIVEHIARYETEVGDITNDEGLKLRYFPNLSTKNYFTWFTTLTPNSICTWEQIEGIFHEQFYVDQPKISLKELSSIKRRSSESLEDYLNRFRILKSRCFTRVPEHELVKMAAGGGGLDFSIRKKFDPHFIKDMSQLVDKVRYVEHLKTEKARVSKDHRNGKVAYVDTEEYSIESENEIMEEGEVNLDELKVGPTYACKPIKLTKGKAVEEPKI